MQTSDFDYDLPVEYIAQAPVEPRDASRLLVLNRQNGLLEHTTFKKIGRYLKTGDLLVVNETRVIPARLYAHKVPGGGKAELLLLRRQDDFTWEALVGGSGLSVGKHLRIEPAADYLPQVEIVAVMDGPRRVVRFTEPIEPYLPKIGHVPLPPYIHTTLLDPERYQTVYSRQPGSVAAPTAGLHFTPRLMKRLSTKGVRFATITLHVGLDTFAPVTEDDPLQHKIHTEWCQVPAETAEMIRQVRQAGGRIVAVGTTSVRTLESAASGKDKITSYIGPTDLFILPGYQFKTVDAMITNFHLPCSTLIMLVSAFAGRESLLNTYEVAKREGYRFYSFGDAMLIL